MRCNPFCYHTTFLPVSEQKRDGTDSGCVTVKKHKARVARLGSMCTCTEFLRALELLSLFQNVKNKTNAFSEHSPQVGVFLMIVDGEKGRFSQNVSC